MIGFVLSVCQRKRTSITCCAALRVHYHGQSIDVNYLRLLMYTGNWTNLEMIIRDATVKPSFVNMNMLGCLS